MGNGRATWQISKLHTTMKTERHLFISNNYKQCRQSTIPTVNSAITDTCIQLTWAVCPIKPLHDSMSRHASSTVHADSIMDTHTHFLFKTTSLILELLQVRSVPKSKLLKSVLVGLLKDRMPFLLAKWQHQSIEGWYCPTGYATYSQAPVVIMPNYRWTIRLSFTAWLVKNNLMVYAWTVNHVTNQMLKSNECHKQ